MSVIETIMDIPMDHERNVSGQFDEYLKKIERTLHVTMVSRDGELKIIGPEDEVHRAKSVFGNLLELSKRGSAITAQNVDYALALSFSEKDGEILEIDRDIICRTVNGRPVKPKTLGQKAYVDAIRKKMIVFGIGPAGTGKTYLAMAMAIRPSRQGRSWDFCRATFRARSIPICGLCMTRCIRLWERRATSITRRRA